MARRLHDLTEQSDNLVRLRGASRGKTRPSGTGENWRFPPWSKFAIPLVILLGLGLSFAASGPVRSMVFSIFGANEGPLMTDDQALALVTSMNPQFLGATEADFRLMFTGVATIDMQMRACSATWPEFKDTAQLTSTLSAALWRAGEIRGLVTPALKLEADAMSQMDSLLRSGPTSFRSRADHEECLSWALSIAMMEAQMPGTGL